MSYAPFPLVWGFFGSGGGGGPAFGVIQTDFGTYPTASSTSDILNLVSADSARYYFTGTALTDTVTLTINGLIPPGGDYGQILTKASGTNFDTEWRDGVLVTSVSNKSGSTITKGAIVYINGTHGNLPTIALSKADAESTSSKTYGFVVDDISNNATGSVISVGQIRNLNTFGVTEGVTLWLSPTTAGGYTTTKPTAPNHAVSVGVCTRAHPSLGTIQVRIQNGYELEELHNVAISSPANGEILQYDSSTSLWKNAAVVGTGSVTSVSVVSANGLAGTVANASTTPAITLSTSITGILKGNGTAISAAVSGTDYEPALTKGNLTESTSSILTITGGTNAIIGSGTTIQVKQASGSQNGYLTSTDWTTFNSKEPALTKGNLTELTSSVLTITGGSNAIIGSGTTIQVKQSSGSQNGYLSSTDWTTFNSKEPALTKGNLTESTSSVLTITGGSNAIIGSGTTIQVKQSSGSQSGYLSSTDWTTFNSKEPALTKGNLTESTSSVLTITGGSNAIIGSGTSIQVKQSSGSQNGYLSSTDWTTFNNKPNLTSTAALSVTTTNAAGTATDAAKSDHTHRGVASFAKNGSTALYGDVTISAGSGVTLTQSGQDISIAATSGGGGTVTDVSIVSANGFAGTVATSTTTPAITLTTSVTGILKGNGTAISAATAGTDYQSPITQGNLTESTSSVLTITNGTSSVIGSGTSIQVKQSSGSQSGYLSSTDWTTFNSKPSITSTAALSVTTANAVGTATDAARSDHTHRGVASFAKNGSTALYGNVTISAGTNVSLTQSSQDVSITTNALDNIFGGGYDGALTASSGTTTLTRDMYYTNVTLSGTAAINTAGYRLYINGTLDITAAGTGAIYNNGAAGGNGGNASSGTGGTAGSAGAAVSANAVGGSVAGAAGVTGSQGSATKTNGTNGPTAGSPYNGGSSGAGGAGGPSGVGGTAGTGGTNATTTQFYISRLANDLLRGTTLVGGGAGGGSGGTGLSGPNTIAATGGTGGGGSGGGVIFIAANTISRGGSTAASTIQAKGGVGGNAGTSVNTGSINGSGGSGGGGGGGGGWVYIMYKTLSGSTATNCIDCSGGSGGNGANGGAGTTASGDGGTGGTGGSGGQVTIVDLGAATVTESAGSTGTAAAAGGTHSGTTVGTGSTGGAGNTFRVNL